MRHHRLYGHEFEQAAGAGDGQGGLVCFSPRGRKESGTTEQLNRTENSFQITFLSQGSNYDKAFRKFL